MTAVLAPVAAALAALADRILRLIQRDPGRHFAPRRSDPGEFDISDAEFEAARQHAITTYGTVPPSLQNVVDHGGRFGMPVSRPSVWQPMPDDRLTVYPWTEREPDPPPLDDPPRITAGRFVPAGSRWDWDLVYEALDGLTGTQWVDRAFAAAEHMVRAAALDAGQVAS